MVSPLRVMNNTSYMEIGLVPLFLSVGFVLLSCTLSFIRGLGLEKSLLLATARTFIQLFAVGYILQFLFQSGQWYWVAAFFIASILTATQIVRGNVGKQSTSYLLPSFASILLTSFFILTVVTGGIIEVRPWWDARFFIPIGGMIISNTMNALGISLGYYFKQMETRRGEVEMRLLLGASPAEASQPIVREALVLGMRPSINTMMSVGIVALPGMMTGQILAGADPVQAIRYQIVVLLMISTATALGSFLCLEWIRRRRFTRQGTLRS